MLQRRLAILGSVLVSGPAFRYGLPPEVRLVLPSAPGGRADALGRSLAGRLATRLKTAFLPESRPGGAGFVAAAEIAEGTPDGAVFGLATPEAIAIRPNIPGLPQLPSPLMPVARIAEIPLVLVADAAIGITEVRSLPEIAGHLPGGLVCGSPGRFDAHHLAVERVRTATNLPITHAICRGPARPLGDVLDGRIPLATADLAAALPHIRSGRLTALGLLTTRRARIAPDLPCLGEVVPGYPGVSNWYGLFAPKETPELLIDPIAGELESILWDQEVAEQMQALGIDPAYVGSRRFRALIADETERWGEIVAGIDQLVPAE